MKKLLLLTCLFFSLGIIAQTACECGEHATGITYYFVGGEEECCTGTAGGDANTTYYVRSENGTWKVARIVPLSAGEAQSNCCEVS